MVYIKGEWVLMVTPELRLTAWQLILFKASKLIWRKLEKSFPMTIRCTSFLPYSTAYPRTCFSFLAEGFQVQMKRFGLLYSMLEMMKTIWRRWKYQKIPYCSRQKSSICLAQGSGKFTRNAVFITAQAKELNMNAEVTRQAAGERGSSTASTIHLVL